MFETTGPTCSYQQHVVIVRYVQLSIWRQFVL